jgi:hypothetical protein
MRTTFQESGQTAIDPDTLRAYREAQYLVTGEQPFTLRIGTHSAALASVHAARRVTGSTFITACNPHGVRLDSAANSQRHAALTAELEECGYATLAGWGADPTGHWPAEPSFLVLGIGLDAARTLGRQFEQNAIVWSAADATPQLVLLR